MTEITKARPSSTVVLARPVDGDPELLLVRRHAKSSFGGAYAFPGGVLEGSDSKVNDHCVGIDESEARELLGVNDALAYLSAAIRELFEESGVEYREQVLPPGLPSLAVEAGATLGWHRWVDDVVGIDRFGMSAPGATVLSEFGINPDNVAARAKALLES